MLKYSGQEGSGTTRFVPNLEIIANLRTVETKQDLKDNITSLYLHECRRHECKYRAKEMSDIIQYPMNLLCTRHVQ